GPARRPLHDRAVGHARRSRSRVSLLSGLDGPVLSDQVLESSAPCDGLSRVGCRLVPHAAFHINGPLLTPKEPGAGTYGGFLGHGYDPLQIGTVADGSALLTGMPMGTESAVRRMDERRTLREQLDLYGRYGNIFPTAHQDLMRKAYALLDSPRIRNA